MPGAGLTGTIHGKASSDKPALKPYWGKPAVRNFRGGHGNVGIIRSPVRTMVLPDGNLLVRIWGGPRSVTAGATRRRDPEINLGRVPPPANRSPTQAHGTCGQYKLSAMQVPVVEVEVKPNAFVLALAALPRSAELPPAQSLQLSLSDSDCCAGDVAPA